MNQPLVDFSYYKSVFLGNLIADEVAFNSVCVKSCAILGNFTMDRVFLDKYRNQDKVKLCACELCELEYLSNLQRKNVVEHNGKDISSEHIGDYSVSYKDAVDLSNPNVIKRKQKDIIDAYLSSLGITYRIGYVL